MSDVHTWDVLADNNTQAPPDGAPENILSSTLNNIMREYQAAIRRWQADNNGSIVSTGAANTYTLAPNSSYTSLFNGLTVTFQPHQDNTGAVTVTVGSLAARNIVDSRNNALTGGEIQFGAPVTIIYSTSTGNFHFAAPALPDIVPVTTRLSIDGTDVVDLANTVAPLRIGPATGFHIEVDANLIQAKFDATSARPLGLNTLGGGVIVGALTDSTNAITLRNAGTIIEGQSGTPLVVRNQAATANPVGGSHAVRFNIHSGGTSPTGDQTIADLGFGGTDFEINNLNHGSLTRLQGEDSGGTLIEMLRLRPALATADITHAQIRQRDVGLVDIGSALMSLRTVSVGTHTIDADDVNRMQDNTSGNTITFENTTDIPIGGWGFIRNASGTTLNITAGTGVTIIGGGSSATGSFFGSIANNSLGMWWHGPTASDYGFAFL